MTTGKAGLMAITLAMIGGCAAVTSQHRGQEQESEHQEQELFVVPASQTVTLTSARIVDKTLVVAVATAETCSRAEGNNVACHQGPGVHVSLGATITNSSWHGSATSNASGEARLSLLDLPEDALSPPRGHKQVTIYNDADGGHRVIKSDARITVHVDNANAVDRSVELSHSDASELLEQLRADPASAITVAARTREAEAAARSAQARDELTACQGEVDRGDLGAARACWRASAEDWTVLDGMSDAASIAGAAKCLDDAASAYADIQQGCAIEPDETDDQLTKKSDCIVAFEHAPLACGPLSLAAAHEAVLANLDLAAVKQRMAPRLAEMRVRQEHAATRDAKLKQEADAVRKLCVGPNALQVVLAIRMGSTLDAKAMRRCSYSVPFGTILQTTRDGWIDVEFGGSDNSGMSAVFRSHHRHADGSFLRTTAKATYYGLMTFNLINGGETTVPAFVLAD